MKTSIKVPSIYGHPTTPVVIKTLPVGGIPDSVKVDYYGEWVWFRLSAGVVSAYTESDRRWAEIRFGEQWSDVLTAAVAV